MGGLTLVNVSSYKTNALGQYKACSVKSMKDPSLISERYEMGTSCKQGTLSYAFNLYRLDHACCYTSGCNKLTSSPSLPTNKETSCLVGERNKAPVNKTCDLKIGVSYSYCAVILILI